MAAAVKSRNSARIDDPKGLRARHQRSFGSGILCFASVAIGQLACVSVPVIGSAEAQPPHVGQASNSQGEAFRFEKWEPNTRSPRIAITDGSLQELQSLCGPADAALANVAQRLARDKKFGSRPDDLDRLTFALRASGSPYVWPRAWTLTMTDNENRPQALSSNFEQWLESFKEVGQRRCGVSSVRGQGGTTYAAVASTVVADLIKPLPTSARTGQWVDLQAQLLRDATATNVILVGTRDEPVSVPASLVERRVRARFPIPGPGPWLIQVIATMDTGPRPIIEAQVFADEQPPQAFEFLPAPGESTQIEGGDLAESLFAMLNAARTEEGRQALTRDPRLDRLAHEHAMAMLSVGQIGHDVGDGSPKDRFENAGIFTNVAGENVAYAASVVRIHRTLWASPSHRTNILYRSFNKVGLAVVRARNDAVWACELFALLADSGPM